MSLQEKKELQHNSCEDCMLCTISKKAHNLRESGKTKWNTISQRSKDLFENTNQRIIEHTNDFSEKYPTTALYIKTSGQNIANTTRRISSNIAVLYQQGNDGVRRVCSHVRESNCFNSVSRFAEDNASLFLLLATANVMCAALFLTFGDSGMTAISGCFLMVGGIFYLLPSLNLIEQLKEEVKNQKPIDNAQKEAPSKLPEYDSVFISVDLSVPPTSPSTYQDIIRTSDATCDPDPLCQVHQLSKTLPDISVQGSEAEKRLSLDNLHGTAASSGV